MYIMAVYLQFHQPAFKKNFQSKNRLKLHYNIVDRFLKDAAEQISMFITHIIQETAQGFAQPSEAHCGVPQSSVLGPLLFLMIYNL